MITTTRCPSCKTRFRVSEEQLKLADGWVRCGHCADIFDATLSLRQQAADDPDATGFEPSRMDAPVPDDSRWGDAASDPDRVKRRQTVDAQAPSQHTQAGALDEPESNRSTPEPEFVREARRREFWHRPAARWAMGLVSVVLLAGLVLQWAVHERDRLAAVDPALQPHLARVCAVLGCQVAPWQSLQDLRIDSATLMRKKGDDYQLDVVLQNQARQPVALPAMELSLTDGREQVIVRRVILPTELSADAVVPGAGSLKLSLPLQVKLSGGQVMAGYRTLIFYP